jgi:hypothetical protein
MPRGTPITTTSGTVIRTGYTAGNGNYGSNTITHYSTQYTHVKILVRRGQHVNQGMLLVGLVVQAWQQGPMFVIVLENGRQVALKLKLPGGEPMKSANKAF